MSKDFIHAHCSPVIIAQLNSRATGNIREHQSGQGSEIIARYLQRSAERKGKRSQATGAIQNQGGAVLHHKGRQGGITRYLQGATGTHREGSILSYHVLTAQRAGTHQVTSYANILCIQHNTSVNSSLATVQQRCCQLPGAVGELHMASAIYGAGQRCGSQGRKDEGAGRSDRETLRSSKIHPVRHVKSHICQHHDNTGLHIRIDTDRSIPGCIENHSIAVHIGGRKAGFTQPHLIVLIRIPLMILLRAIPGQRKLVGEQRVFHPIQGHGSAHILNLAMIPPHFLFCGFLGEAEIVQTEYHPPEHNTGGAAIMRACNLDYGIHTIGADGHFRLGYSRAGYSATGVSGNPAVQKAIVLIFIDAIHQVRLHPERLTSVGCIAVIHHGALLVGKANVLISLRNQVVIFRQLNQGIRVCDVADILHHKGQAESITSLVIRLQKSTIKHIFCAFY